MRLDYWLVAFRCIFRYLSKNRVYAYDRVNNGIVFFFLLFHTYFVLLNGLENIRTRVSIFLEIV